MSLSLLDQPLYTISHIKLSDPPTSLPKLFKGTFRIEIVDGDKNVLKSIRGKIREDEVVWDQEISLSVTAESSINFRVLKKKKIIGEQTTDVFSLLNTQELSNSGICTITLGNGSALSFSIKEDRAKEVLEEGKELLSDIRSEGGESWSTFMAYFKIVKAAADPISGLNSHARQAWSILSAIPDIVQTHFTRSTNLKQLLQRLMDIYKYIADANQLPTLTTNQIQNFKLLFQQTSECSYFIKEYADRNTLGKIWNGPVVDNKIMEFKGVFDRLFNAIQNSIILETSIVTLRVAKSVESLLKSVENVSKLVDETKYSHLLSEMPYAQNAGFVDGKKCLPGTRQKLINEILEWVEMDTSKRVLVLSGQAGMGKSAVAHTMAEFYRTQNRLGSLFCFNRSDKDRINFLFSTLSRDLADGDALWRQNLIQAIQPTAIRKSLDPVTQFNEMIVKPFKDIGTIGSVVIVIDALDESGDRAERETLLNLLFEKSAELPPNYRLIITSRPEPDIQELYKHPNVFCKHISDVDSNDTLRDIQQFVSHKLSTVSRILDARLKHDWRFELAEKSQGLFQWANLACLYINPTVRIGLVERAKTVIMRMSSSLYELYHQILDAVPEFQVDDFFTLFQTVIGAIIVSQEPLSMSALEMLFGPVVEGAMMKDILQSFHSLLIGIDNSTAKIRPLHTSLFDFFLSPELKPGTPNRYYIDMSDRTHTCLRIMNSMLRFNICGLETSHLLNKQVSNLNARVAVAIPPHLSYACCFWAYHLEYSHLSADILKEIRRLIGVNLLYLFEVLSLIGAVKHGIVGMRILENQVKDKYTELAAQAADAWRFAIKFEDTMTKSTPHLYISALPFTPKHSFIYKQYISLQYPQLLSFEGDQSINPPMPDSGIEKRRPDRIKLRSLAFSPQSRLIAAVFYNGDFWVWDHVTGKDIYQWKCRGYKDAVRKVEFSRSGDLAYCYFGTGDVRTWNSKTNTFDELRVEGLRGYCVVVSSDGRYIVSRTKCKANGTETLCELDLYDTETQLTHPLHKKCKWEPTVFSPSGRFFGFEGDDTSYIWDTQMQAHIPHFITKGCRLIALTDSYVLAYIGHFSDYVEVWDIRTGTRVSQLRTGNDGQFNLFPNDKYLLHHQGRTWSVWDILTGHWLSRRSHKSDLKASAISPDSKHIALGEDNGRMHVLAWDILVQETTGDSPSGDAKLLSKVHRCGVWWLRGQYLLWLAPHTNQQTYLIHILDTTKRTSRPDAILKVHSRKNELVTISPEDNHWSIAYIGSSGGLTLWNINEKEAFILNPSLTITSFAFSAAGDRLIDNDSEGNINIWDVRARLLINTRRCSIPNLKQIDALAFSPMGTTFFVAYRTYDENISDVERALIEEQECGSQRMVWGPLQYDQPIRTISIVSDNTHIYTRSYVAPFWKRHCLEILDISMGASKRFDMDMAPRFSPNGKYVAWVPRGDRKKLVLWDKETSVVLDEHSLNSAIALFGFSVDSMKVIILTRTQNVVIWDIQAARTTVMPRFSSNLRARPWDLDNSVCSRGHNFFLIHNDGIGRLWNFSVLEIMAPFYDDHEKNSHFGMLPRPLDDSGTRRLIEDYRLKSEDIEVLEYARVARNKASFALSTKIDKNGWTIGPHGELLFWVPEEMRKSVWYPCMIYTTHENPTKLNFDKFVHGKRWTECRMQPKP